MKALVTGGGGFLGGAIVRQLQDRGDSVRSYSRSFYPNLESSGVEQFQGDLADVATLGPAVEGCDIVYHVAARAGIWGNWESYRAANVTGTENVIAACRTHGVQKLVFTSSPSVVFDGTDMEGVDESVAYAGGFHAAYPRSKALAEQAVIAANDDHLATVSLRPHLIWGPGDNHLVPRIMEKGRARQLRRIGNRENLVDSVYIDNAAEAHLLAGDRLRPGCPIGGKTYFISNREPISVWELIDRILDAGGLPPVTKRIPASVAYAAAAILEWKHRAFSIDTEPRLTRFVARELATAHWFDISAARKDLGYQPRISIEEGLLRLKDWFEKGGGIS